MMPLASYDAKRLELGSISIMSLCFSLYLNPKNVFLNRMLSVYLVFVCVQAKCLIDDVFPGQVPLEKMCF